MILSVENAGQESKEFSCQHEVSGYHQRLQVFGVQILRWIRMELR